MKAPELVEVAEASESASVVLGLGAQVSVQGEARDLVVSDPAQAERRRLCALPFLNAHRVNPRQLRFDDDRPLQVSAIHRCALRTIESQCLWVRMAVTVSNPRTDDDRFRRELAMPASVSPLIEP